MGINRVLIYFNNSLLVVRGECKKPLIIKNSGMWKAYMYNLTCEFTG